MIYNKQGTSAKIIASFITVAVVTLLVLAGPANALSLTVSGLSPNYVKGDDIIFNTAVHVNSGEYLPVDYLEILQDKKSVCTFDVNGNAIKGCKDIEITIVSNTTTNQFGYGLTNGDLVYRINMNKHKQIPVGETDVKVKVYSTSGSSTESAPQTIKVSPPKGNLKQNNK